MARQRKASAQSDDETNTGAGSPLPAPWQTAELFGHQAAEREFLSAFNSGGLHHAWLLIGEHGIGKASFAYRAARFLLSAPEPGAASTLDIARDHAAFRQIAAGAHPSLFVLGERAWRDAAAKTASIGVDDIRKLRGFLGLTNPGAWRAVIVDAANDLTISSANALLKGIEEPPRQTVFFLVSHGAGAVMPTIRSRCVRQRLSALDDADLKHAVRTACQASSSIALPDEAELDRLASLSSGAPGRALALYAGGLLEISQKLDAIFGRLKKLDRAGVHDFIRSVNALKSASATADVFDLMEERLEAMARAAARQGAPQAQAWAHFWQRFRARRIDLETLNLDKGAFLLTTFSDMERIAREAPSTASA